MCTLQSTKLLTGRSLPCAVVEGLLTSACSEFRTVNKLHVRMYIRIIPGFVTRWELCGGAARAQIFHYRPHAWS